MRIFSIMTIFLMSSALSQAAMLTSTCTANPNAGGSGTLGNYGNTSGNFVDYSCAGFMAPSGQQITAIVLNGRADFSFGEPSINTFTINFGSLPVGFANFSASATSSPFTGDSTSASNVPGSSSFTGSLPLANFSGFTARGTSVVSGAFGSSNGQLQVTYTYNPTVPEPSTLALVGGVLVLAGLRKFRS